MRLQSGSVAKSSSSRYGLRLHEGWSNKACELCELEMPGSQTTRVHIFMKITLETQMMIGNRRYERGIRLFEQHQ